MIKATISTKPNAMSCVFNVSNFSNILAPFRRFYFNTVMGYFLCRFMLCVIKVALIKITNVSSATVSIKIRYAPTLRICGSLTFRIDCSSIIVEKISIIGKINPISRVPLEGPIGDFKISLKNEDSVNGSLYFLTKENFKELEEACSRLKKDLKEKLF